MNIKLKIALMLTALLGMMNATEAQNGFNTPFSQFGIGSSDLPYTLPTVSRLGGLVYTRASRNTINPFNPASYSAVESESFVFDIGMNFQTSMLRKDANSQMDADGNLAYIMVAFPLTKWWKTSAGLLPYSSVNYSSIQSAYDEPSQSQVKTIYDGTGGVSQFYLGNAFNIGSRLSLGFNLDYLYGGIQRAITYDFQGKDSTFLVNSRRQKNTQVSNLLIDLGLQYKQPLGEKYTMHLGLTARLPRSMKVNDQSLVYTFYSTSTSETLFDTVFPSSDMSDTYQSDLYQPLSIGAGLSLERNELWEVGLDGFYAPYSDMQYVENPQYSIFGRSSLRYAQNYKVALGGEWKGDKNASSYWMRIGISGGLYFNSGRLALETADNTSYSMNEWGAGMGFTLPMRKGQSLLTLSLGYSSFGDAQLLRRDCFTIGLSIGSCERWFQKRKYN